MIRRPPFERVAAAARTGTLFSVRRLAAVLIAGLILAIAATGRLPAHEQHHAKEPGKHIESMRAVQQKIPQEYRAMDRPPIPTTPASLERGRELFLEHCAVCHGKEGRGDGPAAAGMDPRPANFHDISHSDMYGPGEKFWIITHGASETGMPAFGRLLSDEERWSLVENILGLQGRVGDAGHEKPKARE